MKLAYSPGDMVNVSFTYDPFEFHFCNLDPGVDTVLAMVLNEFEHHVSGFSGHWFMVLVGDQVFYTYTAYMNKVL